MAEEQDVAGAAPARGRGVGRALTLLVASGAAIVGVVVFVVSLLAVGVTALSAGREGGEPCLEAYDADTANAYVHYEVLPPKAVCQWDVDGVRESVVVAQASTPVVVAAVVLVVGGVLTCLVVLLGPRLRARGRPQA